MTGNEKTSEQLKEERRQRFEKNPNSFIEMSEIIVAVKRTPQGVAHYIGAASSQELNIAKIQVQLQIDEIYRKLSKPINPLILRPGSKKGMFGKHN